MGKSVKDGCPSPFLKVNAGDCPTFTVDWRYNASRTIRCWSLFRMNPSTTITVFLVAFSCLSSSEGGILKRHNNNDEEAVQTLLAVGLIAKALSDTESKDKCPPQVTKVIHVPMHHHTERVYVVKEKDEQAWASDNKHIWKKASNVDWKR